MRGDATLLYLHKVMALEEEVRDSGFKPLNGPEIQDHISNRPGFWIQISYEPHLCTYSVLHDIGIKISKWVSIFIKGGIQDSNLNPRKMPRIQDSNLVFKGPKVVMHDIVNGSMTMTWSERGSGPGGIQILF